MKVGIDDVAEMGASWKDFVSGRAYVSYTISWIKPKNSQNELIVFTSVPGKLKIDKEKILEN